MHGLEEEFNEVIHASTFKTAEELKNFDSEKKHSQTPDLFQYNKWQCKSFFESYNFKQFCHIEQA